MTEDIKKQGLFSRRMMYAVSLVIIGALGWIGSNVIPFTSDWYKNKIAEDSTRKANAIYQKVVISLFVSAIKADSMYKINANNRFVAIEDNVKGLMNNQESILGAQTQMQSTITMLITGRVSNKNYLRDCDE